MATLATGVNSKAWEQVIAELDEKKREALEKTWVKVNQDFGSIFRTLLPGTDAKLEPPEGQEFLAGAHVADSPARKRPSHCLLAACMAALGQEEFL